MNHADTRADLAAAFRLTAREGMHEGGANHFSMAVNDEGTQFLINPRRHFSRIRASDLWGGAKKGLTAHQFMSFSTIAKQMKWALDVSYFDRFDLLEACQCNRFLITDEKIINYN